MYMLVVAEAQQLSVIVSYQLKKQQQNLIIFTK